MHWESKDTLRVAFTSCNGIWRCHSQHPIRVTLLCAQLERCLETLNKLFTKSKWLVRHADCGTVMAVQLPCSWQLRRDFWNHSAKERSHGWHESWSNQHVGKDNNFHESWLPLRCSSCLLVVREGARLYYCVQYATIPGFLRPSSMRSAFFVSLKLINNAPTPLWPCVASKTSPQCRQAVLLSPGIPEIRFSSIRMTFLK